MPTLNPRATGTLTSLRRAAKDYWDSDGTSFVRHTKPYPEQIRQNLPRIRRRSETNKTTSEITAGLQ